MSSRVKKQLVSAFFVAAAFSGMALAGLATAASLPDPTRPPSRFVEPSKAAAKVKEDWRLGSILIAPQRRVAVINGRPLAVGDQLNGARLVSIEPDRVRLRRGANEIVLELLTARPTRSVVGEPTR